MIEITCERKDHRSTTLFDSLPIAIGKGAANDLVIEDELVSRHHAVLNENASAFVISDVGSTNGTWINDDRLDSKEFEHGEIIFCRVGETKLHIKLPIKAASKKIKNIIFGNQEYSVEQTADLIMREVAAFLEKHKRHVLGDLSHEQLCDEIKSAIKAVIAEQGIVMNEVDKSEVYKLVIAESIGLGVIEPLLADDEISEIMINGCDQIYVERKGVLEKYNRKFKDSNALRRVIERIVAPIGRRVDESSPMVDARLKDGSRVNIVIPPLALNEGTVTIRKFARNRLTIDDLVRFDALSTAMASFLELCVKMHKNIVVSGGTGSGKTTTLNILSDFISPAERIVTIEDAAELQLSQSHVVSLEARPKNAEGNGEVAIRDLVKNALRMRPDRIVIGECRSGEALDMLQAMNTGHDGSLTTGHANSTRDMLARLEVMCLMSGVDLPVRAIREQIASAVHIIIQQTRFSDGSRRITEIVEVCGMEGDVILMQPIFKFVNTGRSIEGRIQGYYSACGYAPSFYKDVEFSGLKFDRQLFNDTGPSQ